MKSKYKLFNQHYTLVWEGFAYFEGDAWMIALYVLKCPIEASVEWMKQQGLQMS